MDANERELIFKNEIYVIVRAGFIEPVKEYSPVHFLEVGVTANGRE